MLTFAWRQVGIKEYFFYDFGEKKPPLTIGDLGHLKSRDDLLDAKTGLSF
jgi:hypothetical protein